MVWTLHRQSWHRCMYCLCWTTHSHKNTIYSWISHSFRASHSHLEMVVVQSQDAKLVLCSLSCSGDSLYTTGHMIYQTGTNISKHIQIRPFQLSHDKVWHVTCHVTQNRPKCRHEWGLHNGSTPMSLGQVKPEKSPKYWNSYKEGKYKSAIKGQLEK